MMTEFYNITGNEYAPPAPEICISNVMRNNTLISDVYHRIPENLLLNFIGFVALVILFGLLRKKAWNYGRLALLHKTDNRWMELFYGDNDREADATCIETSINTQLSHVDRGFLSWIVTAFKVTDDELLKRAGPDGMLYISFERYLILLTALMMLASICIALPINYHGNMQGDTDSFGHTTLSNLDPDSPLMWIHVILILSYLPIGGIIMRKFMKQVREAKPVGELAARTLLITEIPKHQCDVENLMQYFREAFPTFSVEDVTLAYDIRRLSTLDSERDCAQQARLYCESYAKRKEPLKMYPHYCGQLVGCCCTNNLVDAQEFYTNEEIRLTALVEEEKKVALKKRLGIAFVTLGTPGDARAMRRQLRSSPAIKWNVNYAPTPSDIFWENLSIARPCWYLNATLINLSLFLFLFFLTTPVIMVGIIKSLPITGDIQNLNVLLSTFLPTVLLVSVTALLPAVVGRSESFVRHWTRSSLNRSVMKKTLSLMLVSFLILPSLGLTSVQTALEWVHSGNQTTRWECIFLPDQGAFFVNYVITSALVGCALELVRFPELALYTFRLLTARSRAERIHVRKAVLWEFPLGAHYAWLLLIFTMTTFYSLSCPLITPFGLLYLLIKHLVDRHNLCFAYGPSVGGGHLAGAAANVAGTAPVLAQAAFLALGLVRRKLSPMAAVQLSGLAASILGLVTGATLPSSKPKSHAPKRDLGAGQSFIPPVLRRRFNPAIIQEETVSITSNPAESPISNADSTTSSSLQDSPKLYQNYNNPKV